MNRLKTPPMKHQNSSAPDDSDNSPEHIPRIGQEVRVKHNGRERIAYRDSDGKWRDFHNGNVLQGDVQIMKAEKKPIP